MADDTIDLYDSIGLRECMVGISDFFLTTLEIVSVIRYPHILVI
jgi:hypothetical protein